MRQSFIISFYATLDDLLSFLKKPQDTKAEDLSTVSKLRVFGKLQLVSFLIGIISIAVISGIAELGWVDPESHALQEMMRELPAWSILVLGILVIPFIEEIIFRYGLRFKPGWLTFIYTLLVIIVSVLSIKFLPLVWAIVLILVLIITPVLMILKSNSFVRFLNRQWHNNYGFIFYAAAIIFGLIHISNYTGFNYASFAILLVPILVAPQILGGLLIGYLRVKFGFFWGFALHAVNNAIFLIPALIFISDIDLKLDVTNDQFSVRVEEIYGSADDKLSLLKTDSIGYSHTPLNEIILGLLDKYKSNVNFTGSKHDRKLLNISFKNLGTAPTFIDSKKMLLEEINQIYAFDIKLDSVNKEAWNLIVEDTDKLYPFLVNDTENATSIFKRESQNLIFQNVTLDQLQKHISDEYNIPIGADRISSNTDRYHLELPKNIEELKVVLRHKYGIRVVSSYQLSEIVNIIFD